MLYQRKVRLVAWFLGFALGFLPYTVAFSKSPDLPSPTGGTGYANYADVVGLWDLSEPITFFIPPPVSCRQTLVDALEEWRKCTGGLFTYRLTNNRGQAQVQVTWIKQLKDMPSTVHADVGRTCGGFTACNPQGNGIYCRDVSAHMTIVAPGSDQSLNWATFHNVCLHEIGHLLGIYGHSPNRADIMYGQCSASARLSSDDLDTLLYVYKQRSHLLEEARQMGQQADENPSHVAMRVDSTQGAANVARDYMMYGGQTMQRHWNPPTTSPKGFPVPLTFTIDKDGRVGNIIFSDPSVSSEYVDAAMDAISKSAPLTKPSPEVVASWGADHATVNFCFNYVPPSQLGKTAP